MSSKGLVAADFMTVADAIMLAQRASLDAELWCGIQHRDDRFRVTLTTNDPDPTLSIGEESGGPERAMLLREREQSGPETWDYPAHRTRTRSQYFVRIVGAEQTADVPVIEAPAALMQRYGWTEDEQVVGPALVLRERVAEAIAYCLPTRP